MIGETISHYRIVEKLGAGGLGVVYRAEDVRLQRPVALKALSPDLLDAPEALEWFKREARLTAALNHPGICTIHDVFDHAGRPFIVMELLEGRSLRDELRAGPLAMARLLALATSTADALEAAHAQHVIHRDLKPTNVFVSPDGLHAKVLDFGLAELLGDRRKPRHAPASPLDTTPSVLTLTRVGSGTPAYSSPEQVRGEPLDERSDLFSFGAVLYEMATGQQAFPGATPAAAFDAVLNRSPAPPGQLGHELPAGLEAVILRLLEKDPADRYPTSHALASELRRIRRKTQGPSSPKLLLAGGGSSRGLRAALRHIGPGTLGVGLAVLLAAALALLAQRTRTPAVALTERDYVLLADFTNHTGDPVFDPTLREALAVQLSQSPFLAIVPDDRVRDTLRMMTLPPDERLSHKVAREACQRAGAKAMIEGQIAALGHSYVLTLEATACGSGESLAREQAQADSKERVLQALGRTASSMRARLGESLATVGKFDVPIEQATTGSLEALKAYALGVAQRAGGDDIGAIPFLEHAVVLDPGFASAHSALSAIYGSLGEPEKRAHHARLAHDARGQVTERERLYIEYQLHDALGEDRRAIEILEMWKQLYPRDHRAPNALAVSLNRLGQYQRAIEEAREAERRNPQHPFPRSNLAYAYRGANRFADARRTAEEAIAQQIETLPLRRLLFQLALLQGDTSLAEQTLAWSKGRPREFDLVGAQAQAVAYAGQMTLARPLYQRTVELARRQGLAQVALGYAAQAAWTEALYGNRREALRQAREVLRLEPSAAPRLRAAATLALAGAPQDAARLIAAARQAESGDAFVTMVQVPIAAAVLSLAEGRPAQALTALQPAEPYELGNVALLAPVFLRGRARLEQGDTTGASQEFQAVLDHRGVDPFSPLHALATLELARVRARAGETAASRADYDRFLELWAAADPKLPLLVAARRERAALR